MVVISMMTQIFNVEVDAAVSEVASDQGHSTYKCDISATKFANQREDTQDIRR